MDSMALGLLSHRVEEESLGEVDDTTTTLLYAMHSSIAARPLKMLVFDRTRLSPLFWHFCSPVHIYSLPLIMLHMQCRSLLASTLDEYSRLLFSLFPPFPFYLVVATRSWSPGARDPEDDSTWSSASRSSQEVPGRRPCLFDRCYFCASLLKANLFNLCLYSDIVASADSSMIELLYSSPRGPWLVI